MPFGLGDGLALTVVYVTVRPQAILKLHQDKQISILHLVRYYRCNARRCFYCYGIISYDQARPYNALLTLASGEGSISFR